MIVFATRSSDELHMEVLLWKYLLSHYWNVNSGTAQKNHAPRYWQKLAGLMVPCVFTAERREPIIFRSEASTDVRVVGGKQTDKQDAVPPTKKTVLAAVETQGEKAGFVAMESVDSVSTETVREFIRYHVKDGQTARPDALAALNYVSETQPHEKRGTPPEEASKWLPQVHIMICNIKAYINGKFHGVSFQCLQEYLDEFR